MLKRKVSAIWVLILAVITVFACAFAAVTYIRCVRHMSTPKAKEIGKFRFLNAESDAEGVSFEIINAREVGSDCVLDLRWVNRSGKTIEYGASYELFRRENGKWVKIEPEPELIFPSIGYSINSGFTAELSYTIPSQYKLSPDERYRFQAAFQFQRGSELSGEMINSLEFEVKGEVDSKTDVPSLCIKIKADAEIENDGFLAALCGCDWTVPISDGSGQMINTNACGPGIGAEINLPEANISLPAEATLQFDTQPDTVTVKCLKKGSSVEDICNIDRSDGNYTFSLKTGEYVYRITAEWQNGNRAEYGFAGWGLPTD